ncbi:outer membrane beta-barrel protein [Sediminicola luteus]|uniref:Outer membrane protein beta-barrel domain-containing protein n=1 Tax=Sediminicola luteus TaxID=319238 RepID=A0A2A4G6G1_9FLAO|nr:outer membrane beta-barrel protein [Sediminicola luteus]PCE63570.1 hypothetical protein B7P33_15350 [Sediminicola luteus]
MKKVLFTMALALVSTVAMAQSKSGFGIKGGLNYAKNGDLVSQVEDAANDIFKSENDIGYHIGVFYKLDLPIVFVKPELVYTNTKSKYSDSGVDAEYNVSKIDLPVLAGIGLIGPLEVFAGPSFQYILDNDLDVDGLELRDVENEISMGFQVGLGVSLGKLGADVRYERGFSENEADIIADTVGETVAGKIDSRPSQIIFSVSYKL